MTISPINFKSEITNNFNNNDNNKTKTLKVNSFGGTLGALTAGAVVHQILPAPVSLPILKKMQQLGTLNAEDGKITHDAIKKMLQETGLKDKGVRIKFLKPPRESNKENKNVFDKDKGVRIKFLKPSRGSDKESKNVFDKIYKDIVDMLYITPTRKGQNAFFAPTDIKLPKITLSEYQNLAKAGDSKLLEQKLKEKGIFIKANSVILSKDKFHTAGFHELGHALNYNFSRVGKFLQKCRPVSMFTPVFLGIYGALTKKSKPKYEGEDLSSRQKFNNFLRDNSGKLSFIAALPMLIEEGMATAKGNSFAKKLLSPELAKKVSKSNAVAYCSYITMALFGALAATVAVRIKDSAISKKEAKVLFKQELQALNAD